MPSLKALGVEEWDGLKLCCDVGLVHWREIDAGFYGMAFVFSQNPSMDTAQHEGFFSFFFAIAKISQIFLIKLFK